MAENYDSRWMGNPYIKGYPRKTKMKSKFPRNDRAAEMWRFISSVYSFFKLTAVDYGCGYGDMLLNIANDGASLVAGYEKDMKVFPILTDKIAQTNTTGTIYLYHLDFEKEDEIFEADVALCFSVLPYLRDPYKHLQIMARVHDTCFIECQYAGDGPGFPHIENDEDMREWLQAAGFLEPKIVGKTLAKERFWRTIWMCQKESLKTWHHGIGKPSVPS